jgi:hypothetical protein
VTSSTDDAARETATTFQAPSSTTASAPPDKPVKMKAQSTKSSDSGDTDTGDVELHLPYPQDVFRYGDGTDDELVGHNAKKFSQEDATKIRELAAHNNVLLVERKPEGDKS